MIQQATDKEYAIKVVDTPPLLCIKYSLYKEYTIKVVDTPCVLGPRKRWAARECVCVDGVCVNRGLTLHLLM